MYKTLQIINFCLESFSLMKSSCAQFRKYIDSNIFELQVDRELTESVVTVDWESGFVEASAKTNTNVSQIFKELLTQAKITYNLSPALRRRRQSLPPHQGPNGHHGTPTHTPVNPSHVPSLAQLQHLQRIQEQNIGGKRNSCVIS